MTRKKRQEASQRMKQIWAKRKALKDLNESATEYAAAIPLGKPIAAIQFGSDEAIDEFERLRRIINMVSDLSTAGKKYLLSRYGDA